MKFNSVKEYFYKLNNTGYQLMMVPLILFIYFYSQSYFYQHSPILQQQLIDYLFVALAGLSLITLTIVQLNFAKRTRVIAAEIGLGIKLEKLGSLIKTRMIWLAAVALLMPVGLILSGDQVFSIFFVLALAWYFLHWPTPKRVSELLKLKGDEKQMVLSRGEAFR